MTDATLEHDHDRLLACVQMLLGQNHAFLTELGPLVVAAAALGIASDSRTFARKFDVSHALVIRECVHLTDDLGLLELREHGPAASRIFYQVTDSAKTALS